MGRRIAWWQVPERVRSAVETSLGSSIVEAVTQEGGYSPGTAARVRLATGGRAFVKALSVDSHSASVALIATRRPCKGAVWLDPMMFAVTAEYQGGVDADLMVRGHPLTRHVPESSVDVVVGVGYAAYRLLAQRPVDPAMSGRNAYHLACAEASLRWLQRRAASSHRP